MKDRPREATLNKREWDALLRHLAAALRYTDSLPDALDACAGAPELQRSARVIGDLQTQVKQGTTFAEALDNHADGCSPICRAVIRSGELNGDLGGALGLLCAAREPESIQGYVGYRTMALPALVTLAACAVVLFLLVEIVPAFAEIFSEFGGGLPAPTRLVVDISKFVRYNGLTVLALAPLCVTVPVIVARLVRRRPGGARLLDWMKLRVPVFGPRYHRAVAARFSRSLGTILASGVTPSEGIRLVADSEQNALLRAALSDAAGRVEGAQSLAAAIGGTGFFPGDYCWLLDNAERNGTLGPGLVCLAKTYRQGRSAADQSLVTTWGPILIVLLGLTIALIIISLYMPMFTLGDAICGV